MQAANVRALSGCGRQCLRSCYQEKASTSIFPVVVHWELYPQRSGVMLIGNSTFLPALRCLTEFPMCAGASRLAVL